MTKPVPRVTPESAGYWEGCRHGELRLQRCGACANVQFPPRRFCAACLSDRLDWVRASGCGVVTSFSIVRHPPSPAFAADVPYAVALIRLDEGPTMMAGLRGCDPEVVAVGMRVEVEFEVRSDDIHLPHFHPSAGSTRA
jgi:uncharacterized protein